MFEPSTPSVSSPAKTPASHVPRANGGGALIQRHDLGDAEKQLWALGLDAREEKPPLSYTTPGASLARLRLDLAEQYHRVCSSLGAQEGSFPPVDAGGRLLWPTASDQHAHAGQDLASFAGYPHMMLRPPPFLGAPLPLLYELDQPLAALQAIGHTPPHISDAVSNMWRHANGGQYLGAGRRRGSRMRAPLPQNAPLFLTQGEGVGSPQLDHPQQGSILQEESSLVYPRSHKQSPGAIIHRAPPSSAMLSPGTQMPGIDTLSDFVYSRHNRRKDPPPAQAGLQHKVRDSQDFCNQCSCALFGTFKPELRASGMFDVAEGDISQESIAAAVTEGAAMITQCVEDFLPQFLAGGVQIDSLAGLAECEFRDGEAPQCLIDRVREEFPEASADQGGSGEQAEGGSSSSSSRGSASPSPASNQGGSNFEPDTRQDVEDDVSGAIGKDGASPSPPPSGNKAPPSGSSSSNKAPPSGSKGEGGSSSSRDGSSSGKPGQGGSMPPSPSPAPGSGSGSSSSGADADDTAPPSSSDAAGSGASWASLVLCTAAAFVVLAQL